MSDNTRQNQFAATMPSFTLGLSTYFCPSKKTATLPSISSKWGPLKLTKQTQFSLGLKLRNVMTNYDLSTMFSEMSVARKTPFVALPTGEFFGHFCGLPFPIRMLSAAVQPNPENPSAPRRGGLWLGYGFFRGSRRGRRGVRRTRHFPCTSCHSRERGSPERFCLCNITGTSDPDCERTWIPACAGITETGFRNELSATSRRVTIPPGRDQHPAEP